MLRALPCTAARLYDRRLDAQAKEIPCTKDSGNSTFKPPTPRSRSPAWSAVQVRRCCCCTAKPLSPCTDNKAHPVLRLQRRRVVLVALFWCWRDRFREGALIFDALSHAPTTTACAQATRLTWRSSSSSVWLLKRRPREPAPSPERGFLRCVGAISACLPRASFHTREPQRSREEKRRRCAAVSLMPQCLLLGRVKARAARLAVDVKKQQLFGWLHPRSPTLCVPGGKQAFPLYLWPRNAAARSAMSVSLLALGPKKHSH